MHDGLPLNLAVSPPTGDDTANNVVREDGQFEIKFAELSFSSCVGRWESGWVICRVGGGGPAEKGLQMQAWERAGWDEPAAQTSQFDCSTLWPPASIPHIG